MHTLHDEANATFSDKRPPGAVMASAMTARSGSPRAAGCSTRSRSDGFEMPEATPDSPIERNARVDAFMTATGVEVRHGGQSAYNAPREDVFQMPDEGLFTGTDTSNATEAYYSTLLHETCHWTGHKSRLDRDLGMRFGKDAYAAEELIAELGAAFLCADLQVTPSLREDHAQHIARWLKNMKADKKAIFTAAAKANQALEWLQRKQVAKAA